MSILRNSIQACRLENRHDSYFCIVYRRWFASKKYGKKEEPTKKALGHFDDVYGTIFKKNWPSIRLALLSKPKHVALVNNFGDFEKTIELLINEGALNLKSVLQMSEDEYLEKENESMMHSGKLDEVLNKEFIDETDVVCSDVSDKNVEKGEVEVSEVEEYKNDGDKMDVDHSQSLHKALTKSEIDKSRFIDPDLEIDVNSLHEYVPVSQLKGLEDYIVETDYDRFYKVNMDISVNIEKELSLEYPESLNIFTFPSGDVSTFPEPRCWMSNLLNYYPLDGASILAALALNPKPGDKVLDMCAAPGGKSLTLLQTLIPFRMVCNDISSSRYRRLLNVFDSYLFNFPNDWSTLTVRHGGGNFFTAENDFNKILVDVPCTTDRVSATVEENNIFKGMRTKERLKLPEIQSMLLEHAMRIVRPGGTVVYCTCSLSPIQNDGVVSMALHKLLKEDNMEFTVIDMTPALKRWSNFYRFSFDTGLKFGSLVLPFVPVNFGPMYFSKIIKNK